MTNVVPSVVGPSAPPPELFNARIDVHATLAANAAALGGSRVLTNLYTAWRDAAQGEVTPDGRVAIGVIVEFLEKRKGAIGSGIFRNTPFGLRSIPNTRPSTCSRHYTSVCLLEAVCDGSFARLLLSRQA